MAEPVNTTIGAVSLVTIAVAFFGPLAGPYAVILLGSMGGSLWALSSATLTTRAQGVWLLTRTVVTALVLTAVISQYIGPLAQIADVETYAVVAFTIGMLGNRWQDIIDAVKVRLVALISTGGKS